MKPNILVCGYTGSGKTSLLQAFCGTGVVPEDAIGHGEPETYQFNTYDSEQVVFRDSRGMEMGDKEEEFIDYVQDFVRSNQATDDVDDHIHILWYCIAGDRAGVTDCDKTLIEDLFPTTLVVVTKNDIMRPKQREGLTTELLSVGLPEDNIVFCSSDEGSGLPRLLNRTLDLMPRAYQAAFESLVLLREREFAEQADDIAEAVIRYSVKRAATIGLIPLPSIDIPLLVDVQYQMIGAIAAAYGFAVSKETADRFLKTIGIGAVGMFIARFLVFPVKSPAVAGITFGIGRAVKKWYEAEMRLPNQELRRIYEINRKKLPEPAQE